MEKKCKGAQREQSAAQKYRGAIPNPEITRYMLVTYVATGILTLIMHMGN